MTSDSIRIAWPDCRSKTQYAAAASAAGVPAIIGGGIYPGCSNVMAAHIISISRKEYDDDWQYMDTPGASVDSAEG